MSPIQNHSPKPYTIIEDSLLDCNLSIYEKMVLISLIKYAGKANRAWPGVKTIAANAGICERQARRILRHLEENDLLRTESRSGRSSLYHIPQFTVINGQLSGKWSDDSTPDSQSEPPRHTSHPPRTAGPGRADCQSPKYYQGKVSKKNSLSEEPTTVPSPVPEKSIPKPQQKKNTEREDFDSELIETWSNHFSIQHKPGSLKEQQAMDWMLFASKSNQLYQIKSPIAYLKTITLKGHSQDFIPFQMRKSSTVTPVHLRMTARQKWSCINQTYKKGLFLEAKEKGIPEGDIDYFAFQIFEKEYAREQNQLQR